MLIYGQDASHYDDPPDAARLIAEGFSFYTHKAGGDGNDAELAASWNAIKAHRFTHTAYDENGDSYLAAADGSPGILVGAYWVVRPDLHSNAAADADAFLARLDSQSPGWRDGPFILQADCESWGDSSGKKKPNKAHIKAFCDRLRAKMPKLMPIVYASKGDYGDTLTGLGYPLWNARYSLSDQTGTASGLYARALAAGSGWVRYSGQMPAIWQFTSSATIAGQTTCDANAYLGSLADLTALLAPGWDMDMAVDLSQDSINKVAAATAQAVMDVRLTDPDSPVDPTTGKRGTKAVSSILAYRDHVDTEQATRVINALIDAQQTDTAAIVAGVLAKLDASTIAAQVVAALPADEAKQTAQAIVDLIATAQSSGSSTGQ